MAFKIRYTRSAAKELDEILTYIKERSPQGARNVQARIHEVINLIAILPTIGRSTRKRPDIRRLNTQPYPYVIFYTAGKGEIIIRCIRHMARRPV
jgi:toxin ParE1/3/4